MSQIEYHNINIHVLVNPRNHKTNAIHCCKISIENSKQKSNLCTALDVTRSFLEFEVPIY